MRHRKLPIFSVQYHPEASAGPHDSTYLFDEFRQMLGS
jgi:carbamoyl-phosphate synthase small subunit